MKGHIREESVSLRNQLRHQPVGCRSFSWANRHFFKTHEAMDCDPFVWSQVDEQIETIVQSNFPVRVAEGEAELAAAEIH